MDPDDNEREEVAQPVAKGSWISNFFFCWALPFFYRRYRNGADDENYKVLEQQEAGKLGDKLEFEWMKETVKNAPSLWRALWRTFRWEFGRYLGLYLAIEFVLKPSQPLYIGRLMRALATNNTDTVYQIYLYGSLILLTNTINVLVAHKYYFAIQHLGMKVRIACCSLIYRKALRISHKTLAETGAGKLINLLSNDVSRFDMAAMHFMQFLVAPLEAVVLLSLMFYSVGWTVSAGVALLIVFIPCQIYLGKKTAAFRLRTATKTDQRVKLMNEIIGGIQAIKTYAWEKAFVRLVEKARKLEIDQITPANNLRAITVSFMIFLNRTGTFLCILAYVLYWHRIDGQHVFMIIAFYSILRQTLTVHIPAGFNSFNETKVSVQRIRAFLVSGEIDCRQTVTYVGLENGKMLKEVATVLETEIKPGVSLERVAFRYNESSTDWALEDINLEAKSAQLVAIVGQVGSGKTTLLKAIIQELPVCQGTVLVEGTISYAAQEPWLFSSTIRQNILFGRPLDDKRYHEVVQVCCLQPDFNFLSHGDRTVVGDRGVLLSGGQKARIGLARAIYKQADIYLLDDPLSAVDSQVGKEIFTKCFKGFLKDKCTVLVMHQCQYLESVDKFYLMSRGKIAAGAADHQPKNEEICKQTEQQGEINGQVGCHVSKTKSEKIQAGTISKHIYEQYLKAGGAVYFLVIVAALFILTQVGASAADYFPAFWVNQDLTGHTHLNFRYCTYIYSSVILLTIAITIVRSLTFFRFCIRASTQLHNDMFTRIVKAPMSFFKDNSAGVILNRFSKDMGLIDEALPMVAMDTIQIALIVLGLTSVVTVVNPWILIPALFTFLTSYCFRLVFLASSRDLKRKEAAARSPVYGHTATTLQGLSTIRALDAQDALKLEFDRYQDRHTSISYVFLACNRAFGFWLDIFYLVFVAAVIVSTMFMETGAGNVGLSITQVLSLTGVFQWGMRQWSALENQMTSVERVLEYTEITPETDDESKLPTKEWPSEGNIQFKDVRLRYAPEEPVVLNNLNFSIKSKEKIGIVGRTGAGKSSLISAIFRLAPLEGTILIDNVDTKHISLNSLRSRISIIPQEPVLFSGTLRKNLDPFDEFEDAELWTALEEVELKNQIIDLPAGLQSVISEGGSNFSVGQRQLLCLARAVIRSNRILVLDEATASVDPQTDELIQNTIRRKFEDCTVLTIAHRLHTVMDSNRILVMDGGKAVEFDQPHVLLQDVDGVFYGLVKQTGRGVADNLMKVAEEAFFQRGGNKTSSL